MCLANQFFGTEIDHDDHDSIIYPHDEKAKAELKEKATSTWLNSESWFDTKLMVDGTRSDANWLECMATEKTIV